MAEQDVFKIYKYITQRTDKSVDKIDKYIRIYEGC